MNICRLAIINYVYSIVHVHDFLSMVYGPHNGHLYSGPNIFYVGFWKRFPILETKPNRSSGKIKLTLPADCHITWFSSQGWFLQGWFHNDVKKAQMVVFGTEKCLGWQYPMLLLVLAVQISQCWFCFISAIKEPAQPSQAGFWALIMPNLHFVLWPLPAIPSPTIRHPPSMSIPDTSLLVQLARFYILLGWNFYKQ